MRPRELIPGNCYFLLTYYDDDLKLPFIITYLYEREDQGPGNRRIWLFRDPASVAPGDDDEAAGEQEAELPVLTAIDEDQLYQILDLNGLVASLGDLIHLHPPLHAFPGAPESVELRTDIPELGALVGAILESDGRRSVTITIRHTDDGFSFGRDADGLCASFFPKARLEAEHERGIRAVFAERGMTPLSDYLSQHGRVRVLVYRLAAQRDFLEVLAKQLLREVYRMRQADELRIIWQDFE